MEENIDIELADYAIRKLVPELNEQNEKDRYEKIELLYKYGYIFMPYDKEFVNPLTNKSIKLQIIQFSVDQIQKNLDKDTLINNEQVEFLTNVIYRKSDKASIVKIFLGGSSILWGGGLYIFGILLSLPFPFLAITIQIVAICLIHYWISHQALFAKFEDFTQTANIYIKYGKWLQYARISIIILTLYDIYKYFDGTLLFAAYGIFVALFLTTNYFITAHLKENWWTLNGLTIFEKYYKK